MKKALNKFESSRNLQTATASNEHVALLSKETVAKSSAREPEKFTGKCRRWGKSGHKQATCRVTQCNFCRRFGHEENKRFKKNRLLKPRSSAETGVSNLAEDLIFVRGGSVTALTSQNFEVKEQTLVIDSGASSHMFLTVLCFLTLAKEHNAKQKRRMGLFRKLRVLEKFLLYFWTKMGSNVL